MDEYISPYDFKIARYVIFDIREVAPRDSRFITAARVIRPPRSMENIFITHGFYDIFRPCMKQF